MNKQQKVKLYESIMRNLSVQVKQRLYGNDYDLLIESLINSPELNKDLKFVETDRCEIERMLDTDEYNYGYFFKDSNIRIDTYNTYLGEYASYFKIQYKDSNLGFFSMVDGDTLTYEINGEYSAFLRIIYGAMIYNALVHEYPELDVINIDCIEKHKKSFRNLKDDDERFRKFNNFLKDAMSRKVPLFKEIAKDSAYIAFWAMNQKIKKQLDVNDFALTKIFFKMLMSFIGERGYKFIFAAGKDKHTKDAYVKLGGFRDLSKLFMKLRYLSKHNEDYFHIFDTRAYDDDGYEHTFNLNVIKPM